MAFISSAAQRIEVSLVCIAQIGNDLVEPAARRIQIWPTDGDERKLSYDTLARCDGTPAEDTQTLGGRVAYVQMFMAFVFVDDIKVLVAPRTPDRIIVFWCRELRPVAGISCSMSKLAAVHGSATALGLPQE